MQHKEVKLVESSLFSSLACPNCGTTEPFEDCLDHGASISPSHVVVLCKGCRAKYKIVGNILDFNIGGTGNEQCVQGWVKYYQNDSNLPPLPLGGGAGNRDYPRKEHIFRHFRSSLRGKVVLDVGCGAGQAVFGVCHPDEYGYQYIGVDVSLEALHLARQRIPSGYFLRLPIDKLILKPATVDLIFSFGLLMYLTDPMTVLARFKTWLKPGGQIALHEPIERKRGLSGLSIMGRFLGGVDADTQGRPLNQEQLLLELLSQGGQIVSLNKENSALRTWLAWCCGTRMQNSLRLTKAILALDRACIRYLGRLIGPCGAGSILLLFRKAG